MFGGVLAGPPGGPALFAVRSAVGVEVVPVSRQQVNPEGYWDDLSNREGSAEPGSDPASRPSITDRADPENGDDTAQQADTDETPEKAIPGILEAFSDEFPDMVNRAVSMVPGRRLRKECVREIRGGDREGAFKSRLTRGVLKEFLRWYYEQEGTDIIFESPDGGEVRADAPNSYSDEYGRKWYGRLKDLEREFVRVAPDPHTVMLSLTASTTDESGQPRPPGDHLRGLQDAWSPYVRRELQRTMENYGFTERYDPSIDRDLASAMKIVFGDGEPVKWWEYLTVVEPHGGGGDATGYGHFHVVVFASHEIPEEAFRPVMEKHVEKCEGAEWSAHDIDHSKPEKRPVSVNAVDPSEGDIDRDVVEGMAWLMDEEQPTWDIGNVASYVSEYIGGFSGPVDERPLYELLFQAVCWSTNTQRVRPSNGANKLSEQGRIRRKGLDLPEPGWEVSAIENERGERHPPSQKGSSFMVEILDTSAAHPDDRDRNPRGGGRGVPPPPTSGETNA
jgi:hypothetical protein